MQENYTKIAHSYWRTDKQTETVLNTDQIQIGLWMFDLSCCKKNLLNKLDIIHSKGLWFILGASNTFLTETYETLLYKTSFISI